jgi:transcriptional regulator with XRE-family HTH domain
MEDHQRRIGQRIVELREARDWGQPELAAASRISVKTISRLENGHVEGRRHTLRSIAVALDVTRADLEGEPPAPLGLGVDDQLPALPEVATRDDVDRIDAKLDALLTAFGVKIGDDDPREAVLQLLEEAARQPGRQRDAQLGDDEPPAQGGQAS